MKKRYSPEKKEIRRAKEIKKHSAKMGRRISRLIRDGRLILDPTTKTVKVA